MVGTRPFNATFSLSRSNLALKGYAVMNCCPMFGGTRGGIGDWMLDIYSDLYSDFGEY